MYAVREKRSKQVIHINPAPLDQELDGKDVYHEFDGRTMEIGRIEGPLPEHFDITDDGKIVELDLETKVEAGFVQLAPHETVRDGEIVEKTLAEKVSDGLITVEPEQKVLDERIVPKSRGELLEEGLVSLGDLKKQRKEQLLTEGLQQREKILPSHMVVDALLGIANVDKLPAYRKTIKAFHKARDRIEAQVNAATSVDALDGVKARFPKKIARTGSRPRTKTPRDVPARKSRKTGKTKVTRKKARKTVTAKKAKKTVRARKAKQKKKVRKTRKKRTDTR